MKLLYGKHNAKVGHRDLHVRIRNNVGCRTSGAGFEGARKRKRVLASVLLRRV